MKKIAIALMTLSVLTISTVVNSATETKMPIELVQPNTTITDIYNFLDKSLALTATQKPAVKKLVDEAGVQTTKLNADATKTDAEKATAKTNIVNNLIKQLGNGILKSTQTTKLGSIANQLVVMFSQLK